jgi:hypothetical protein
VGPEDIDEAIAEVERARKRLSKLKVRQIGASEHRDFLKATALSWFRNRRASVSSMLQPELLTAIDESYQRVLDATERYSSRTTYVSAVREAKDALVLARSRVLTAAPKTHTTNSPPDFTPLASDAVMQAILTRRWEECDRCLQVGAPLAATIMMGGLLEALFVSRANKLANKSVLFASPAAPIDGKSKKPLELRHWTLAPYIDVGHELKWISRSAKDVAVVLRDYRNYVHPEKERSHGVVLSQDDAMMLWEVTRGLVKELLSMKGAS